MKGKEEKKEKRKVARGCRLILIVIPAVRTDFLGLYPIHRYASVACWEINER